ncbi:UDP-3-O-acyl-N-acetylglucosamine deacetylase [Azospirillum sp. sgz301742]
MTHIGGNTDGMFQHTLKSVIRCTGIGLHSGASATLTISPAAPEAGITFIRTDKRGFAARIPATYDNVVDTRLCTVLGNAEGTTVGTVEHVLAALAGCGIDNAILSIDGPEVPIMDGSAAPFVAAIERAGRVEQNAVRHVIRILKPVTIGSGRTTATLMPSQSAVFSFEIDFDSAVIGQQTGHFELSAGHFGQEIGAARTFCFLHDVEAMQRAGLARGGSLDNAVVVDKEQDRVLNADGLRSPDEFVRHKILDAVGDLYLAGGPILGRYHGSRAGHAMNNQLLRALFADRSAWCYDTPAAMLPSGWCAYEPRAVA